ncbi:hypothetical protein ABL78_2160 [Leptomonas seymouri]|nr:hypothetical protein ABL78_2160 [Leptomonas seymouri]|eukprot:KPI88700.1 hypothetical protein ABL78_2160 [Leptomonas seymouri]
MAMSCRFGVLTAVALTLLMCLTVLFASAKAHHGASTVAGWVDVRPDVAPYVVLHVVDDSTGVVVRSAPLGATHTFSFAGIMLTSVSVEAVAQLPDHLFELDVASSVMKTPVPLTGSTAAVQLKVAAIAKTSATVAAARKSSAQGTAAVGSGVLPATLALVVLTASWFGRRRIVSILAMPAWKPPRPHTMLVGA